MQTVAEVLAQPYRNTTKATLANAVAFVHFAQRTNGLHSKTCGALQDLYTFEMKAPHYRFSAEAILLGQSSPLGRACMRLREMGYFPRRRGFDTPREIEFWNIKEERYATAYRNGDIFTYPESGRWAKMVDGVRHDYTHRFNVKDA